MSPRLPRTTARKLIAALLRAGFFEHHHTGSHMILRHSSDPARRVTVPDHSRDLKIATVQSIIKQSGLTAEEIIDLL